MKKISKERLERFAWTDTPIKFYKNVDELNEEYKKKYGDKIKIKKFNTDK